MKMTGLRDVVLGIGAGATAVLFGEISRTTTQKERTAAFTIVIAISEMGLIIGPAMNLFLRHLDYKFGPFVLDKYTSPGVCMQGHNKIYLHLMKICRH